MNIVSILSEASGRWLSTSADGAISAGRNAPDAATRLLAAVHNRSGVVEPRTGDSLVLRFTASDNVWRAGWDYDGSRPVARIVPPRRERMSAFATAGRFSAAIGSNPIVAYHLAADRPRPDANPNVQQFVVVSTGERFDPERGLQVRLVLPIAGSRLAELHPSFLAQSQYESIDSRRSALLGRDLPSPFGRGIAASFVGVDGSGRAWLAPLPWAGAGGLFRVLPHSVRAFVRAPDGQPLGVGGDGISLVVRGPGSDSGRPADPARDDDVFSLLPNTAPFVADLRAGDRVVLRADYGMLVGLAADGRTLARVARGGLALRIEPVATAGSTVEGVPVRLVATLPGPRDALGGSTVEAYLGVLGPTRIAKLLSDRNDPSTQWLIDPYQTVRLLANGEDRASSATDLPGYTHVRAQARVLLGPRADSVPLRRYAAAATVTGSVVDQLTTATEWGADRARRQGYRYQRLEGFVGAREFPGALPLTLYARPPRGTAVDHRLVIGDDDAVGLEGYAPMSLEGFARPPVASAAPGTDRPTLSIDPRLLHPVAGGGGLPPLELRPGLLRPRRPVRALVLSGGGAKGCFEAGALQYLWNERGYRPDIICGVSVGAINAVKLGEGRARSADELVELWLSNASAPDRIFRRDHYPTLLARYLDYATKQLGDAAMEAALLSAVGFFAGPIIGPLLGGPVGGMALGALGGSQVFGTSGFALGGLVGGLLPPSLIGLVGGVSGGAALALGGRDVDGRFTRALNVAMTLVHALHSMQPLRERIREHMDGAALAASGIRLRLGITDVKSGQYFSVTEPVATYNGEAYGRVETEPDHRLGENWLSRPLLGGEAYAMRLRDAVYASSALPVYMDPAFMDLRDVGLDPSRRLTVLPTAGANTPLPPGVQELLEAADAALAHEPPRWDQFERRVDAIFGGDAFPPVSIPDQFAANEDAHGVRGRDGLRRYFMDGGLRDTLPIRTALRLGATEVLVITGDRVQTFSNALASPQQLPTRDLLSLIGSGFSGVDIGGAPLFRHMLGLLGLWFNEASRNDMTTAVAHNEFAAWLARASARLPESARRELLDEFAQYQRTVGAARYGLLGGVNPVGGRPGESFSPDAARAEPGATIQYLAPDREIVDALDFDNERAVRDGIALGQRLARELPVISRP